MPLSPNKNTSASADDTNNPTLPVRGLESAPAGSQPARLRPKQSRLAATALLVLCVVLAAVIVINRNAVVDWWRLRGYQPPADVKQLADQDTMTSYTKHLFYLNRPQLLASVTSFRKFCPENKETIVLGCYHPGQNGIYIYQVKDPELYGVSQVTAAHEVLHAVYARLSSSDRKHLDTLLNDYYKNGLHDPQVKAEVKLYQTTEPNDVMDEMSCTFGTEIADLPPSLEAYYNRYFSNRSAIVRYEQQYEATFTARQAKIKQYDQQLSSMKQQIDSSEASLQAMQTQLGTAQDRLKQQLAAGQNDAYNAAIPAYNSQVNSYNAGVTDLKKRIAEYNQLVDERNAVASELTTLDKALDTRLTTQAVH